MSMTGRDSYDAVIIGAGIGGLICGCYLAKAGMKVLVAEQHDKPGGYCASFQRKDFLFDAAAHSFGSYREGGNFRRILAELGIDKLIKIKRFDPSDVVITPDFKISFFNDTAKTISNLSEIFPEEKNNILRYFNFVTTLNQLGAVTLKDKTFSDLLETFFKDTRLITSISVPVFGNGGLPPSLLHAFTGSRIFAEFLIDGGYYPDSGMQSLPNALDSIIKQYNGTILYKSFVKEILLDNDSVSGIKLDNDKSFFSKYVVSACDVTQTFQTMLGDKIKGTSLAEKLQYMMPSLSTFILYIGIDKPFNGLPQNGTNIWYLPYYDLDKLFTHIKIGDFKNISGFMFRVSPDNKTILAFFPAPFKTSSFWKENKNKIAQEYLNRIEKLIPGLKEHVAYFDAATPLTLYKYTRNYGGANYGWAPLISQLFDPAFRQKSFVNGLYITGHWTAQTHGIPGVAYLGYNTAKLILKREKISL
jgi:phytoene dehydrogenase-like protein